MNDISISKESMEKELAVLGFEKELRLWSFKPTLLTEDGYYYCKFVPNNGKDEQSNQSEIGIVISPKFGSMQVYSCNCVVGCCGRSHGIMPFSIENIKNCIKDESEYYD